MRIAIVGAGAIGGWLGVSLAGAGYEVSMLARGATLAVLRADGLRLSVKDNTRVAKLRASDNAAELGTQDLVIIAVKGPALAAVAPAVAQMLGPDTIVLPAMNGVPWWFSEGLTGALAGMALRSVDPGGLIARTIPASQVIGCVVHVSCSLAVPGHIIHTGGNRLIIGEPRGGPSARLAALHSALEQGGLEITASSHIQTDIWYKLWGNMTMNPISALTGALADRILDDVLVRAFMLSVMAEARETGRRIGCPIAETGEDRIKVTRKLGAFKTSMLQDVEAGRPLEIDALLAAPREIAQRAGVETPFMDVLHGLVRLFAATRMNER